MTSSMVAEAWEEKKFGAQDTFWKLKSIFNLKQNHSRNKKMGLKLTIPISNFKAGIFSMPTWFFDVNYPLRIILTSVVRKRKLGTQGNILQKRIPLSTNISCLGAPQSMYRFSTLQVILVDRCPVPSDLQPGGRPSPPKNVLLSPIAPGYVQWVWNCFRHEKRFWLAPKPPACIANV